MKLRMILFFITIMVLALLQGGCKKGDEGPQGPPGESESLEGFATGIKCGDCHNPETDTVNYLWARRYQWERSKHAYGGDLERNGPDCAGCHTSEGFIARHRAGWVSQSTSSQANPSPPGCFACHSPHTRGNFSLRDASPVSLLSPIAGISDPTFDYGKGNLCARCHQPRSINPEPDPTKTAATDTIVITSSRWYPHYGVQSQMLMGEGGFEFAGYTYQGNSNHSDNAVIKEEGCIKCHMASQVYPPDLGTGRGGGHTMKIRYSSEEGANDTLFVLSGCNESGCHGANAFTKARILAEEQPVVDSLHALEQALVARGWLTASGNVNASASRPLRIAPAEKAGAIFNYFFVEHDLSRGMHNKKYAQDLLNSSLQALRTP